MRRNENRNESKSSSYLRYFQLNVSLKFSIIFALNQTVLKGKVDLMVVWVDNIEPHVPKRKSLFSEQRNSTADLNFLQVLFDRMRMYKILTWSTHEDRDEYKRSQFAKLS